MHITFIQPSGASKTIEAKPQKTIMEAAVCNNIRGILAKCGGSCSRATCHVHVDEAWLPKLPPQNRAESETLIFANNVTPASRLTCQIKMVPELDGIILHLPA